MYNLKLGVSIVGGKMGEYIMKVWFSLGDKGGFFWVRDIGVKRE